MKENKEEEVEGGGSIKVMLSYGDVCTECEINISESILLHKLQI